ncbi:hypothetical protein ABLG96_11475 [Nakamurella sp. A5-74]|uniref:Integral membrane protein n=1 Tax=Nakamurella sp. A5-74 TaxID=3158264 RepID=A0AAU8DKK3_9ACTN
MLPGLVGAVLAALCYGAASVSQALGVHRFAEASADLPLTARLRRAGPYLLGTVLDLCGFLASLVALRTLPLFLVQSVIATSVAVTAVLARKIFGTVLRRSEVLALLLVVVGLGCLAVSGVSSPAHPIPAVGSLVLVLFVVPLAGLAVVAGHRTPVAPSTGSAAGGGPRRGWLLLAVVAGLAYGAVGIAARVLVTPHPWWHLLGDPVAWVLAGYATLGTICYALALARGRVTVVASVSVVIETVVPTMVGLLWLGDAVRRGFGICAAIGFVVTTGGCLALCRNKELVDLERAVRSGHSTPSR